MKKIRFNNLPAGSIILTKEYNLWQRFKAWLTKKPLKYNDAWIDPFGNSDFTFASTWWNKADVFVFTPIKQYSNKEKVALFEKVIGHSVVTGDPVESILMINLIRKNTFSGSTLEELLDNNKYYVKKEVK